MEIEPGETQSDRTHQSNKFLDGFVGVIEQIHTTKMEKGIKTVVGKRQELTIRVHQEDM